MKGIYRSRMQRGPAALTLVTAARRPGQPAPYEDEIDPTTRAIRYRYRAGSPDQPDNRALRAAHELQVPLIYFLGVAPGQYTAIAPVFVREDDPHGGAVVLEPGLPFQDTQGEGIVSSTGARGEQFAMVVRRLDQVRFRRDVLRAYRDRCAVCTLREIDLLEAAHITRYADIGSVDAVVNGIALCAIHHLAYDRNLMGIDPGGVVHIAERLLREADGPMLRSGIQGFHGETIHVPRRRDEQPDPERLATRFERFLAA